MTECTNPCKTFFEESKTDKVLHLQAEANRYEWEKLTASSYSPCPVSDEEDLYRIVFNPIHIDQESGELKPTAFSDVKDKGCSVNRTKYTTLDQTVDQGKIVAQGHSSGSRSVFGVAKINALKTRQIAVGENELQAFGVFDTALEDNPSHADICQLVSEKPSSLSRSARLQLLKLAIPQTTKID